MMLRLLSNKKKSVPRETSERSSSSLQLLLMVKVALLQLRGRQTAREVTCPDLITEGPFSSE